jgi:uncharacterized protein YukE
MGLRYTVCVKSGIVFGGDRINMQKSLQYGIIFSLLFFGVFFTLDNYIIRYYIVDYLQDRLGKTVYLDSVSIQYMPKLVVTLWEIMIPNPYGDNYIVRSDDVTITIHWLALLQKRLVIDSIASTSTVFFDTTTRTISINDRVRPTVPVTIPSLLPLSWDMDDGLDPNPAATTPDVTVAMASINASADTIRDEAQTIQSLLDALPSPSDLTLAKAVENRLMDAQTRMADLANQYDQLNQDYQAFHEAMGDSLTQVPSSNAVHMATQSSVLVPVMDDFMMQLRAIANQLTQPTRGNIYTFGASVFPAVWIKSITINTPEANDYLRVSNITGDPELFKQFSFYFHKKSPPIIPSMVITGVYDTDSVVLSGGVANGIIPSMTIYNTDAYNILLADNTAWSATFNGRIGLSSAQATLRVTVPDPSYKLLNKQSVFTPLSYLLPLINHIPVDMTLSAQYHNGQSTTTIDSSALDVIDRVKRMGIIPTGGMYGVMPGAVTQQKIALSRFEKHFAKRNTQLKQQLDVLNAHYQAIQSAYARATQSPEQN